MLRQVLIFKDGDIIYQRDYGKALDQDGIRQAYKQIAGEAFQVAVESTKYHDFFRYRIAYLAVPEKKVLFYFVSDLSDKFGNIEKELIRARKEFMDMFGSILDEQIDEETFEIFDPTIELIHKNLRPKISLVGFSGVGKTTITRLITAEDIPTEHVPTITGDIGTIKIGKLHFHLWDFAGQEQFSFLWNNFIKGSDAVLLITDSTLENCEKSRYFTELIKKEAPHSHAACIGNKQDLPDAMPIADIERILGLKAYSMIAVDPNNRDKMITIIADILEMAGEISPLLKPLIERDKILTQAEGALEAGQFQESMELFEKLADLSLELGDDRVSQDFHEKAMKIQTILQQFSGSEEQVETVETPKIPSLDHMKPAPSVVPTTSTPTGPAAAEQNASAIPPKPEVSIPLKPEVASVPPKPEVSIPLKPEVASVPPKPEVNLPLKPEVASVPPKPDVRAPPSDTTEVPSSSTTSGEPQKVDKLDLLLNKTKSKNEGSGISKPTLPQDIAKTKTQVPPPAPKPAAPSLKPVGPPPAPSVGATSIPSGGAQDPRKLITELKIKMANVNKTLLDMEMQNITGELSDEDFKIKSGRLESLKSRIDAQIKELENI